jgi:hypothetical protein
VIVCVPVPTAVGVYVTEQEDDVAVGVPSVQEVPGLENAPAPLEAKLTEPVGADFVPVPVSVTVAVHTLPCETTTLPGTQLTAVVVGRCPALKVTVMAPPEPKTSEQGFVVPVHVLLDAFATPLHPANVEPPFAVALNVIVAALSDVVMFGEHVLVTVCEAAFVPVPPHETGALIVPVLGVIVTEPLPAPANVSTQFRAAAT